MESLSHAWTQSHRSACPQPPFRRTILPPSARGRADERSWRYELGGVAESAAPSPVSPGRNAPKPRESRTGAGRRAIGSLRLGSGPSRRDATAGPFPSTRIHVLIAQDTVPDESDGSVSEIPPERCPTGTRCDTRTSSSRTGQSREPGKHVRAWHCKTCKETTYDDGPGRPPDQVTLLQLAGVHTGTMVHMESPASMSVGRAIVVPAGAVTEPRRGVDGYRPQRGRISHHHQVGKLGDKTYHWELRDSSGALLADGMDTTNTLPEALLEFAAQIESQPP